MKLPGVGDRLAKKVLEIIETGHLKRLDHIDPKVETLKLFSGVWGTGPKTAETWVARVTFFSISNSFTGSHLFCFYNSDEMDVFCLSYVTRRYTNILGFRKVLGRVY